MEENEATVPLLVNDVAALSQHHTTTSASLTVLKARGREHMQLHNTHLVNQQAGNTSALQHDYMARSYASPSTMPGPFEKSDRSWLHVVLTSGLQREIRER